MAKRLSGVISAVFILSGLVLLAQRCFGGAWQVRESRFQQAGQIGGNGQIWLTVVEKREMEQVIVADEAIRLFIKEHRLGQTLWQLQPSWTSPPPGCAAPFLYFVPFPRASCTSSSSPRARPRAIAPCRLRAAAAAEKAAKEALDNARVALGKCMRVRSDSPRVSDGGGTADPSAAATLRQAHACAGA